MNGKELLLFLEEKFKEHNVSVQQFVNEDMEQTSFEELKKALGPWQYAAQRRDNALYTYVLFFVDHNIYIEFDGDYDSWSGTTFDSCVPYEVTKETKMVEYWKEV